METNYDICQMLDDKMMEYSAYVILHRALPSLEDGFKISLRRILYTMYKENMTKLTKSANVSGQVMKIHPHSDCYPTIVNMVQKDNHVNPFIDGKGAFAYHTSRDTQPASSRYSEVKINQYSLDMMQGLKRDGVDMIPTFDGSTVEPTYLPTMHCNLLTQSQQGMAVGMATNFPSFNLVEVCDYTIDTIKGNEVGNLIPDFATGGKIVLNENQINNINNNGSGSVDIQSRYEIEGDYILIKEIPYTTTREAIIDKIIDLCRSGKLKEIADVKDTTDIKGMEIEIKVKKSVDKDLLMQKLYKLTPLQSSFSANMNCLVNNSPMVLGVKSIISKWLIFRKQCLKRELEYDINSYSKEANVLRGLKLILLDIDKCIAIIRNSDTEQEAISNLMEQMKLNKEQAEYVADIKLRNLNKSYLTKKIERLGLLEESLFHMQENLSSDAYYNQTIIDQLEYIKKTYGKPRRTSIIHEDTVDTIKQDDLIENYNCNIVLSQQGYIKKTLRYSDTQKVKDGDSIIQQIQSTNKSKLLLFTDKANCYYVNCYELDQTQPSNLGTYLPSSLQLQDENIIYVASTEDFKGYMLFGFKNGKVAKVDMNSYATKTNRTKCINAYNTNDNLVSISYIEKDCDYMAVSSIDKVLVFNTSQINSKSSKNTMGVTVLRSKNGSTMIEFKPCDIDNPDYYRANIPAIGSYRK